VVRASGGPHVVTRMEIGAKTLDVTRNQEALLDSRVRVRGQPGAGGQADQLGVDVADAILMKYAFLNARNTDLPPTRYVGPPEDDLEAQPRPLVALQWQGCCARPQPLNMLEQPLLRPRAGNSRLRPFHESQLHSLVGREFVGEQRFDGFETGRYSRSFLRRQDTCCIQSRELDGVEDRVIWIHGEYRELIPNQSLFAGWRFRESVITSSARREFKNSDGETCIVHARNALAE
jgi:hypothetical protein